MGPMDGNLYDSQSSKYFQPTFSLKGVALATAGCYQANNGRSIRVAEARR
jgi:hypothetical protein